MAAAKVQKIAEVEQFGAYHLVTYGVWQVTVMNDGTISAACTAVNPDSVDDLVNAFLAAVPVAKKQRDDNESAQVQMEAFFKAQREKTAKLEAEARKAPRNAAPEAPPAPRAAQRPRSKVGGPRAPRQAAPAAPAKATRAVVRQPKAPVKTAQQPAKKATKKAAPRKK
jgi:hypothetical protein